MNNLSKRFRNGKRRRSCSLLFVLLLLAAASAFLAHTASAAEDGEARLQAAWEQARRAGSYAFDANIDQQVIPAPMASNAGRRSQRRPLYLQGVAIPATGEMELTLWHNGGSIADPSSGTQLKIEGDRAYVRDGLGAWEAVDNFTQGFAPGGDFLAYTAAAADVRELGTGQQAGISYTRYAFDIDGPGFARYVREQLQAELAAKGRLPVGISLDLPRQYVEMTGSGELWIGADGLPLRQMLDLTFPQPDGGRVQARVTANFADFGQHAAVGAGDKVSTALTRLFDVSPLQASAWRQAAAGWLWTFVAILLLLPLFWLALTHHRSPHLYTALALLIVLSMLLTPFLQGQQVMAYHEEQTAAPSAAAAAAAAGPASSLLSPPLSPPAISPFLGMLDTTTTDTTTCELDGALYEAGDTDDRDGDGLTDYEECILGTDPTYEDSDGDLISDAQEVEAGGDPMARDSNGDGILDTSEWPAGDDTGPADTDGDGVTDILDDDNDNDGVPDGLDLSPFAAGSETFGESTPFSLIVDDLTEGEPTFVEFQLRPVNEDHLWYAFNVFDWPQGDDAGVMRDVDGKTFADSGATGASDADGDIKLIPMLEIRIRGDDDNLPEPVEHVVTHDDGTTSTELRYPTLQNDYGIIVRSVQQTAAGGATETVKAAYVPLHLVTDSKTGQHQAFSGRMVYEPDDVWGNADEVRLTWVVAALADVCTGAGADGCQTYDYNRVQILHTYYEEWTLTGMHVREDHGVDLAIVYEDPAEDDNLNEDIGLVQMVASLDELFLTGRDCDAVTDDGACAGDGERDITVAEIERRFALDSSPTITEQWGITTTFGIVRNSYDHVDQALATTVQTRTLSILNGVFSDYRPITPTLLFVREEQARILNLDGGAGKLSWNDHELTIGFKPADDSSDEVAVETFAALSWTPYHQDEADNWQAMDLVAYAEGLADRYLDENSTPEEAGQLGVYQVYYLGIAAGLANLVERGTAPVNAPGLTQNELEWKVFVQTLSKTVLGFVNMFIINPIFASPGDFWLLMAALNADQYSELRVTLTTGEVRTIRTSLARTSQALGTVGKALTYASLALTIVSVGLLATTLFTDNPTIYRAVRALSLVGAAVGVISTAVTLTSTIITRAADMGLRLAAASVAFTTVTRLGIISGLIGLAVSIGIIWGVFIYQVVSNGLSVRSPEFGMLVASAVAATVVTVVLFLIGLTTIGLVVVAILALVDAILALTPLGFTVTLWLIGRLSEALYDYDLIPIVGVQEVEVGDVTVRLQHPDWGMRGDNAIVVSTRVTTTIQHEDPDADFYDIASSRHLEDLWTKETLESTIFNYRISEPPDFDSKTHWELEYAFEEHGQDLYSGTSVQAPTSNAIPLTPGINVWPDVQLVTGYKLPAAECERFIDYISICEETTLDGSIGHYLDMTFDVFPETLDEFVAMDWGGWSVFVTSYRDDNISGNVRSGGIDFPTPFDRDGDDVRAIEAGGIDPNDGLWDTDGDGLHDGRELDLRQEGLAIFLIAADSDGDGLSDGEEMRLDTWPDRYDSDGDGLSDGEEVHGWTFTYATGKSIQVTSNPLLPDSDGDGLSDAAERALHLGNPAQYPYHPRVTNRQPVALGTAFGGDIVPVRGMTFASPGAGLIYTATVANNISEALYAQGTLTMTMPALLNSDVYTFPIDYYGGESRAFSVSATVPGDAGSQKAEIIDEVLAQLQPDQPPGKLLLLASAAMTGTESYVITDTVNIYKAAVTAVDEAAWGVPFLALAVEGFADDGGGGFYEAQGAHVALYAVNPDNDDPLQLLQRLDFVGESFAQGADIYPTTVDIACNDSNVCLAVWSELQDRGPSGGESTYDIRGAWLAPGVAPEMIQISAGAEGWLDVVDADQWLSNLRPSVASDGDDFMVAWVATTNATGDPAEGGTHVMAKNITSNQDPPFNLHVYTRTVRSDALVPIAAVGDDEYLVLTVQDDGNTIALPELSSSGWEPHAPQGFPNLRGMANIVFDYDRDTGAGMLLALTGGANVVIYSVPFELVPHVSLGPVTSLPDLVGTAPVVSWHAESATWVVANAGEGVVTYGLLDADGTVEQDPLSVTRGFTQGGVLALDCGQTCALASAAGSQRQLNYLDTYRVFEPPPAQGALFQTRTDELFVDAHGPVVEFDGAGARRYFAADDVATTVMVGGRAEDGPDGVGVGQVLVTLGAETTPAVGRESWVFPLLLPAGEGVYTLQATAEDLLGNAGAAAGATVIVDGSGPQPVIDAVGDLTQVGDGWMLPVSGVVADPAVAAGHDGSGVAGVAVRLAPDGHWQTATFTETTGAWTVDYTLFNQRPGFAVPSGAYTLEVRATDAVGNMGHGAQQVDLDGEAPLPQLQTIDGSDPADVTFITGTAALSGVISDTSSGIDSLEISLTDIEVAPGETPAPDWQPVTLSDSGSGVLQADWSATVPAGLEGFYAIEMRATDVAANNVVLGLWAGAIDTNAPRLSASARYQGSGSSARTQFSVLATDFSLLETGLAIAPCADAGVPVSIQRTNYESELYSSSGGDPVRLYELRLTCTAPGHVAASFDVTACDAHGACTTETVNTPGASDGATLDAAVLDPAPATVLTTLDPVDIFAGAYAENSLQSLTLTVDGATLDSMNWDNGVVTDTTWTTTWTPPAEGAYLLAGAVSDWAGADAPLDTVTVTVDIAPPAITISNTLLNRADLVNGNRLDLSGSAADSAGVAAVEVQIDGGPWQPATINGTAAGGYDWVYAWTFDTPLQETFSVAARVTDLAGRAAEASANVNVDLVLPANITTTAAFVDGSGASLPLQAGQTLTNATSLTLSWTESASADVSGYLAGWSASPVPDPALLTSYPAAGDHTISAPDAERLYAHVGVEDANGNRRWESLGPVYVDAPGTPDLIDNLDYLGWTANGCTQVGASYDILYSAATGAALHEAQRLFMSWDSSNLRLTWSGANWNDSGDLQIYLDAGSGGATTPDGGAAFVLPFAADYLLWVEDDDSAGLRQWDGAAWSDVAGWPAADGSQFRIDARLDPMPTDLLVPLDLLGSPAEVSLVAVALDEDAPLAWATIPNQNPLDSALVLNTLAQGHVDGPFDYTQALSVALDSGVCTAGGADAGTLPARSDLQVSISAAPEGVATGYLGDGWYDLLAPGGRLDEDGDGVLDSPLPLDALPPAVGAGQAVTFTVRYENLGEAAATGVQLALDAHHGLANLSAGVLDLGTIEPGASGAATFTAVFDGSHDAAELTAALSESGRGVYDWLWLHHAIDNDPPGGLTILAPGDFVPASTVLVRGAVQDASDVPLVEFQANGAAIDCLDTQSDEGVWSCSWDLIGAGDGTTFNIQARATDRFGNVSDWTAPRAVVVDTNPPSVIFDSATNSALDDGLLTGEELLLRGRVNDDRRAAAVLVCLNNVDNCTRLPTGPAGAWRYVLPSGLADREPHTLDFYGIDSAGNRSASPRRESFFVDNLGPTLVVEQQLGFIASDAYDPPQANAAPVLGGTISDGSGVARLVARLDAPGGEQVWSDVELNGGEWEYVPNLSGVAAPGFYHVRLLAYDTVGNIRGYGTFTFSADILTVDAGGPYSGDEGEAIQLNGMSAAAGATYQWETTGGGQFQNGSSATPRVTYPDNGVFDITLTVTAQGVSASDTAQVSVANVAPVVDAGADRTVAEGDEFSFDGSFGDPGTADTHTIAWEFGDGATAGGVLAPSHIYADNGVYTATLTVTDDDGGVGNDTVVITVDNVAPIVQIMVDDSAIDESGVINLTAQFADPGFDCPGCLSPSEESFTATIDWGYGDWQTTFVAVYTPGEPGVSSSGTFSAGQVYGDNGDFVVTVTIADDDLGVGTESVLVTVNNVDPSVEIDESATTTFHSGDEAFLTRRGTPFSFSGTLQDIGSDDLIVSWSFPPTPVQAGSTYYNDGLAADLYPSPGPLFPFMVTDTLNITPQAPGVYNGTLLLGDDDGGTAQDSTPLLVTDSRNCSNVVGFWRQQFRGNNQTIDDERLTGYLEIVRFASTYFDDDNLGSLAQARHILTRPNGGNPHFYRAEEGALLAWLNFAGGGVLWDDTISGAGSLYYEVMTEIERVLLDDGSSNQDYRGVAQLAQRINTSDLGGCTDPGPVTGPPIEIAP